MTVPSIMTAEDIYEAIGAEYCESISERELDLVRRTAYYVVTQTQRVNTAIEICFRWHGDQTRVVNKETEEEEPYAMHPVRVATTVRSHGGSYHQTIAAYCHDLLEDTRIPLIELQQDLTEAEIQMVQELTAPVGLAGSRQERFAAKLKHDLEMSVESYLIRLADIDDNVKCIEHLGEDFAKVYLCEKYLQFETLKKKFANVDFVAEVRMLESAVGISIDYLKGELFDDDLLFDRMLSPYLPFLADL